MQVDRSLRSVFVGNIPYDATEEKLRDIFSAVGPVLSFRIVFDRETGKPKGYGFCEYKDQETATSAIRNLNGHDLGGRQLRVDSASNERARDEPSDQQQQQQHQQQSQQQQLHQQQQQYQQQQNQQTAPSENIQLNQLQQQVQPVVDGQTVINNVLQCSPPEQLFDVCKQLKASLLINPNETRQLLVQNPQLSYAVLQSLVMVKAIDVERVFDLLHKGLVQAPLQTMMAAPMTQMPAIPTMTPMPTMPPMQQLPTVPAMPAMATLPLNQITPGPLPPAPTYDPRLTAVDPRLARQQQQQQQQQQPGPQPPSQWPSASM